MIVTTLKEYREEEGESITVIQFIELLYASGNLDAELFVRHQGKAEVQALVALESGEERLVIVI